MKKLLALLFSILISLNSYGELKNIANNVNGDSFYVYNDTINKHNGYVYYWSLIDFITPNSFGERSAKGYYQADCGLNRKKLLSGMWYEQPMGAGKFVTENYDNPKWDYSPPGSAIESVVEYVCEYIN